jgi:hypothetical protein
MKKRLEKISLPPFAGIILIRSAGIISAILLKEDAPR